MSVEAEWAARVAEVRAAHEESIGGPDGWLALAAQFTLRPFATTTLGADPSCDVRLPHGAPPRLGSLTVGHGGVRFVSHTGGERELRLPAMLELGSLRLSLTPAEGEVRGRVSDADSAARRAFRGLAWAPLDPCFRLMARLAPAPLGTTLPVEKMDGSRVQWPSPGRLIFTFAGREHALTAHRLDGAGLVIVFRDLTAGASSYEGGRMLDAGTPDGRGDVELDFNCAYSPPCAFTPLAICPLPPRENHLPFAITAGEHLHP